MEARPDLTDVFEPRSPEAKLVHLLDTIKQPDPLGGPQEQQQQQQTFTPSSATRQLFQSSPPQTRVFKPLLAPNSPVAAAPESELLLSIARKKAEIAAAAATQELVALEKAAGISPIQTNQIIQPAQTINIAAALQRQTTEQAAARPPTHPNKQEPAQIASPLTPDEVPALPQATNATNTNSEPRKMTVIITQPIP